MANKDGCLFVSAVHEAQQAVGGARWNCCAFSNLMVALKTYSAVIRSTSATSARDATTACAHR